MKGEQWFAMIIMGCSIMTAMGVYFIQSTLLDILNELKKLNSKPI